MIGAVLALLLAQVATVPTATPASGGPSVVARPSKSEVTVGEGFTVEVVAAGPPGTTWTFPDAVGDESVELRTAPPPRPDAVTAPASRRYDAAVFAVSDAKIPAITVRYRLADGTEGEVSTEPVEMKVGSLLPREAKEQTLTDLRGPVTVTTGMPFWIGLVVLVALLAGLVYWLRRRTRPNAAEVPATPATPPDVEALAALDRLAASGLVERDEFRAYYIELAEIAKKYLERRLGAPVLEMTSSEMAAYLRDHPHGADLFGAMRDLAGAADTIKFARGEGMRAEAERHMAAARELIAGLERRLQPSPQPPPGAKVA